MGRGRRSIWAPSKPRNYPRDLEANVLLRDGTSAFLRPITPHDADALLQFHRGQSEQSRYMRFFTAKPDLTAAELDTLTRVDYVNNLALIAVLGERIVAVGRFTGTNQGKADIAFHVADDMQSKGLGTILFDFLAAAARERGITVFTADVLPDNTRMLSMFDDAGYEIRTRESDGIIQVEADTLETDRVRAVLEERERAAEARSVALMFDPDSIVIVGASRQRDHVGAQIVRGLVASGYSGAIYPVNPEAYEVNGLKSYAKISAIPGRADLAILAINPERCVQSVEALAERGVKAVVVVSSGFAEAGAEGAEVQDRLLAEARKHGIRVLGPSSLGFFRTGDHPLNASLSPRISERGSVALAGQSTALCAMVLAGADARGIRVREFISAGNRADISINDALQRWEEDDSVSVIALSLESMGNPRKFVRLARRISAKKQIVVVRPPNDAESGAGDMLTSHSQLPREAIDQVLDESGVIRTESVDHLLDTVSVLSREGNSRGSRVGLLANSTALGATLRAAADEAGLDVVAENYRVPIVGDDRFVSRAFTAMAGPGGVDSVIISIVDTQQVDLVHLAQELETLARGAAVQVLIVVVTAEPRLQTLREAVRGNPGLPPVFSTPQRAADALAAAHAPTAAIHAHARSHPAQGRGYSPLVNTEAAAEVAELLDSAMEGLRPGQEKKLSRRDTSQILGAYGIPSQPLATGVTGGAAVEVRAIEDRALGPVVSFSIAGDATDIFHDVHYAVPPLSDRAARRLITGPRASARLEAAAPESSAGRAALLDLVRRIAELQDNHPRLSEVFLRPVLVNEQGLSVIDIAVKVAHAPYRPDSLRRTLPPYGTGRIRA